MGYKCYEAMKSRCYNKKDDSYIRYGGIGITICDRWLYGEKDKSGWECFIDDMGPRPSTNLSIDRIDNDGNYCPENCRWATAKEQQRNKKNNVLVTIENQTKCVAEWCEIYNLAPSTYQNRIVRGWSEVEAIITPPEDQSENSSNYPKIYLEIDGEKKSLLEWSQISGVDKKTIRHRISKNWPAKEAVFKIPEPTNKNPFNDNGPNNTLKINIDGEIKSLKEWSRISGIDYKVVYARYYMGWDIKDAIFKQVEDQTVYITIGDKTMDCKNWSEISGIPPEIIRSRYSKYNWSSEDAVFRPLSKRSKFYKED
ncbi:MAG: hypothetical protein ACHQ1D_00380 [Nitrososphaerales archaeon]